MHRQLRESSAHVFVESLDAPVLATDDAHHLFRVLRLRDGDLVSASDGCGRWRACAVRGGALEATAAIADGETAAQCAVAAAIPKGDRLEWMVQKLTEIGAQRIVLLDAAHSVVRWDGERADRQLDRLRRIIRESAAQSRRCRLPVLEGPLSFAEVLRERGAVLADPDGAPLASRHAHGPLLIGPEGGWSAAERSMAAESGIEHVSLGETVLRVETAAVVGAALLMAGSSRR